MSVAKGQRLDARALVESFVAEEMDRLHCSNEKLELLEEQEIKGLRDRHPRHLRTDWRATALLMMMQANLRVGLPFECWCQAVRVLDSSTASHDRFEALLEEAAAAWMLCAKMEQAEVARVSTCAYAIMEALSNECEELGLEVKWADVARKERLLLSSIPGSLSASTVMAWLIPMAFRFEVAMGGRCPGMGNVIVQWAQPLVTKMLLSNVADRVNTPRLQATGILGLMLAIIGFLPADMLRPDDMDSAWWSRALEIIFETTGAEILHQSSQSFGVVVLQENIYTAVIELATGRNLLVMQEGALTVLGVGLGTTLRLSRNMMFSGESV